MATIELISKVARHPRRVGPMARSNRGWRLDVANFASARRRRAAANSNSADAAIAVHSQKRESGWLNRRSRGLTPLRKGSVASRCKENLSEQDQKREDQQGGQFNTTKYGRSDSEIGVVVIVFLGYFGHFERVDLGVDI